MKRLTMTVACGSFLLTSVAVAGHGNKCDGLMCMPLVYCPNGVYCHPQPGYWCECKNVGGICTCLAVPIGSGGEDDCRDDLGIDCDDL